VWWIDEGWWRVSQDPSDWFFWLYAKNIRCSRKHKITVTHTKCIPVSLLESRFYSPMSFTNSHFQQHFVTSNSSISCSIDSLTRASTLIRLFRSENADWSDRTLNPATSSWK
jgi:hypothetical protein